MGKETVGSAVFCERAWPVFRTVFMVCSVRGEGGMWPVFSTVHAVFSERVGPVFRTVFILCSVRGGVAYVQHCSCCVLFGGVACSEDCVYAVFCAGGVACGQNCAYVSTGPAAADSAGPTSLLSPQ